MTPQHPFKNKQLAELALTHRSMGKPNNERLEWLGDALLQFHCSAIIYEKFAFVSEGGMSFIRTQLVCGETLARLARRIGLPPLLRLGTVEQSHGRDNDNILEGAMEAYLAAVHLDGGDVRHLLQRLLAEELEDIGEKIQRDGLRALRDPKTRLQEFLQAQGKKIPSYQLIKETGKAHQRVFLVECRADDSCVRWASATSVLAAQQKAAEQCLQQLQSGGEKRA